MCRIAGVINKQVPLLKLQQLTKLMCDTLQHGGPDDEGLYINQENSFCFGHRRLSLIDLSAKGHQPMADVHQRAWITFNGEIYNYPELKSQLLAKGALFYSDTDTEVIIQAYLHWGKEAFGKLRGMFAFALHDTVHQLTYLVRDSNGIKPLYYHKDHEQLSFASEVKALKAAGISTEFESDWKIKFLTYGHIPEPYTTLKNVFSLPKSSYLCWHHPTGTHQIEKYNLIVNTRQITNWAEAQQLVKDALTNAIKRQLIADAPVGVFLSGGIDSSLLALLANQQHNSLQYISIYFNEQAYDERHYQKLVTSNITGEQHAHLVTYQDFASSLPQITNTMDMPTTDGINTWFISKYAHQNGLKAVLSGLGADELFGGYPSFRRINYIKYLKLLPLKLIADVMSSKHDGYKRLAFLNHQGITAEYLFLRGIFTPVEVAKLLDCTTTEVEQSLFSSAIDNYKHISGAARAGLLETHLYMQNQLLRDTDVMSMGHGLEVRVPFLDEDFTGVLEGVTPELRYSSLPVKKLLINSFGKLLPEQVWNRPKMGFTFPLQQWMSNCADISNADLYKRQAAKEVIQKFKANQLHWSKAFALYQLQPYA